MVTTRGVDDVGPKLWWRRIRSLVRISEVVDLVDIELDRCLNHLIHVGDEDELDFFPNVFGNLSQISLVVDWGDQAPNPMPVCRERLVSQSTDWQHLSAQGDLAGHRGVIPHRLPG